MTAIEASSFNTYAAQARTRVVINGRFLTQAMTGVQRYAIEVVHALDGLCSTGEIDGRHFALELLAPRGATNPRLRSIGFKRAGVLHGHAWEQFELPWLTRGSLLVNLCNTAPLAKKNQTITIHDAAVQAVPEAYSRAFRAWYQLLLPRVARRAKRVVTVSHFSKLELMRWLTIPAEKCVVVSEGREHIETVQADRSIFTRLGFGGRSFVLAVSSMNPNKNFQAIVDSLQWLGDAAFDLVIAGATNPRVFASDGKELPSFVKHIGYVTDAELKALYEHAECFVYPSLYEGFGLPPLEAMACGCPVIVSDVASLPEVCGDAALYCDPRDPQSIAQQIRRVMTDPELRTRLCLAGSARAQQFSWERCAREIWKAIEGTVDSLPLIEEYP